MIGYPWGALVTGLMLILASSFTMGRHFMLEPSSKHYPKAPPVVLLGMFGFACIMMFLGLQYLWTFMFDHRETVPPQPGPAIQLLSTALVLYKGTLFFNIWSQRDTTEDSGSWVNGRSCTSTN